jgi:hypothetical protein
MPQVLTDEIINAAIEGFESQKKRIDSQIANLRAILTARSAEPSTPLVDGSAEPSVPTSEPKRTISAAARRRMALGQKKRWAAMKKTPAPQPSESPEAPKKSRLSPAGRRAIAAAAKKRWAMKKAAEAQKAKSLAAKKTAGTKTSGKVAKKAATKKTANESGPAGAAAQPAGQ